MTTSPGSADPPKHNPAGAPPRFQFRLTHLLIAFVWLAILLAFVTQRYGIELFFLAVCSWCVLLCLRPTRRFAGTWGTILLVASLVPAYRKASDLVQRSVCSAHLSQVRYALRSYHAEFDCFPPAYVVDASGQPAHSWRVLILPYMNEEALYRQYHFDEPWDGPRNRQLLAMRPALFGCPDQAPGTHTSYLAVVSPNSVWPGASSWDSAHLANARPSALMLVETASQSIPWTKPQDLDVATMSYQINSGSGIGSVHYGGASAITLERRTQFLSNGTSPQELREMLTIGHSDASPAE